MRTTPRVLCALALVSMLFVSGIAYLCTHGIQENGWLCVVMTSSRPMDSSLVGRTIQVDDKSSIKVTGISRNSNVDGSVESYIIHANLLCLHKQWFSLSDRAPRRQYLVSAELLESTLRHEANLPDSATTDLRADYLLP